MTFLGRKYVLALAQWGLLLSGPDVVDPRQNPSPESSAAVQLFKIAGTVVDSVTGAPLDQARISLSETKDREKVISMITTENGYFEFSNLKTGKYSLQGAKRGFISSAYEQHEQYSTAIVTRAEFSTDHLVLRLTPMALISGHVFDENGDAVRSARVALYLEDHRGGMSRIVRLRSATSDDQGFFDFSPLRPGKYFLCVTAKPWYAVHPNSAIGGTGNSAEGGVSASLDVTYPTTYYSGATEANAATPIEVKGGDRLRIDMHLYPERALHLILRVPQNEGEQQNRPNIPTLEKHVFDSEEFVQMEGMRSVAPGLYELVGVPPGRYTVRVRNPDSGQQELSSDIDLVHDSQELDTSHSEPFGSLKLTLKMPGEQTLPEDYGVGLQDLQRRMVAFQQGDSVGQFSFEGLRPGKYAILVASSTKPYAIMRISSQLGDSPGHEVNITPGGSLELTASLSVGIVSIEGVVHKKDKMAAGVMVALVPKDPEAHVELFRRDQSDFDGTFLLRGVIPGFYTVIAVEDAWGFDWLEPGVLAKYLQHGQELTIGELMRGAVHLPEPVEVQAH